MNESGMKTNLDVLRELCKHALDTLHAMRPIIASELNLPVGDVDVIGTARGDLEVVTIGVNFGDDFPNCHDLASPRGANAEVALSLLKQKLKDLAFEAAEKETSDDK